MPWPLYIPPIVSYDIFYETIWELNQDIWNLLHLLHPHTCEMTHLWEVMTLMTPLMTIMTHYDKVF